MSVLRTIPWHNVDIWLLSVEVALLSCEAWALITIWNLFNVDQKNIRKCEHSTIKLQINHFCSFSRQTTALRSALISGGAGGNRSPRGIIFIFRSLFNKTQTGAGGIHGEPRIPMDWNSRFLAAQVLQQSWQSVSLYSYVCVCRMWWCYFGLQIIFSLFQTFSSYFPCSCRD